MDLVRVPQGATQLIKITFADGATPLDPDGQAATVAITRDDGTELVPAGTSAPRQAAGVYGFQLEVEHTELLDHLSVTWSASFDGVATTLRTRCEIVGGYLFTLAEARALDGLEADKFSDEEIANARILVEEVLEQAIECALVPRYTRERLGGDDSRHVRATWPRISSLRACAIAGTALTADELEQVAFAGRLLRRACRWPEGLGNVEVTYEHGYAAPPLRGVRAGLRLARAWLIDGHVPDRATEMFTDDGRFRLMTPGFGGFLFELPEVEAFIDQYSHRGA